MYKFCKRVQLDKFFGDEAKFHSAEFCAEAETKEQAVKEVEEWIKEYVREKKAEMAKKKKETVKEIVKKSGVIIKEPF